MRQKSKKNQWLETIQHRRKLSKEEKEELIRLEKGFDGESEMDRQVNKFLAEDILILDDITLEYHGSLVQIDKIIIVGNILYLIDMKNYQGNYRLENNNWYYEGKILPYNILEQLRRAVRVVIGILQDHGVLLEVKGVLAFTNRNSCITIKDSISEIVLQHADIDLWLSRLNQQSHQSCYACKTILRQYTVEPYPCDKRTHLNELQPGICCPNCHGFSMTESEYVMTCSCHFVEVKEKSYARTICEYGVLFPDKDLRWKDLLLFFGSKVNTRYLKKILEIYFTPIRISKKRNLGHINKGVIFDYWFADLIDHFEQMKNRKHWKSRHNEKHY